MFFNAALTPDDIDNTLDITDRAFAELKRQLPSLPAQSNELVLQRLGR